MCLITCSSTRSSQVFSTRHDTIVLPYCHGFPSPHVRRLSISSLCTSILPLVGCTSLRLLNDDDIRWLSPFVTNSLFRQCTSQPLTLAQLLLCADVVQPVQVSSPACLYEDLLRVRFSMISVWKSGCILVQTGRYMASTTLDVCRWLVLRKQKPFERFTKRVKQFLSGSLHCAQFSELPSNVP